MQVQVKLKRRDYKIIQTVAGNKVNNNYCSMLNIVKAGKSLNKGKKFWKQEHLKRLVVDKFSPSYSAYLSPGRQNKIYKNKIFVSTWIYLNFGQILSRYIRIRVKVTPRVLLLKQPNSIDRQKTLHILMEYILI